MLLVNNKIQTAKGSLSVDSILRSNNIVYTAVEMQEGVKTFNIRKIDLLCVDRYVPVNVIRFEGAVGCYEIVLDSGETYYISKKCKLLRGFYDKNLWFTLDNLKPYSTLLTVKGREVSNVKIRTIKYVGKKPTWTFVSSDIEFVLLQNGLVLKYAQREADDIYNR